MRSRGFTVIELLAAMVSCGIRPEHERVADTSTNGQSADTPLRPGPVHRSAVSSRLAGVLQAPIVLEVDATAIDANPKPVRNRGLVIVAGTSAGPIGTVQDQSRRSPKPFTSRHG